MLSEKQINNYLEKYWDSKYSAYTSEAEWYGGDVPKNVWICDIPSQMKSVRLTLDLETKQILVEERKILKYNSLHSIYGEWVTIQ